MRARAPHRWRRTLIRLAALCLPILALGGCIFPPEPMTTEAEEIRTLFLVIFALGAVVFVAVEGFLVYAAVRYRRRDDRLPEQIHGNTKVEIVWTVIPTIIVLILFVTEHGDPGQHHGPGRQPASRSRSRASSGTGRSTTPTATR